MSVVLVTGSSRGLGRSIVLEYAKRGFDVIIHYHKEIEKAKELEEFIKKTYDVKTLIVQADLRVEEDIDKMYREVMKKFSNIDVLVNNAAIQRDCDFLDKTKKDFQEIFDVNVIACFLMSKKFGLKMQENGGSIINISSTNGLDTYYVEGLDYDASKAALISLSHNLATYFAPKLRVNTVCPGWIDTDMSKDLDESYRKKEEEKILLHRFAKKEEIAPLIYFLGSTEASYINDSVIRIDGGVKR